jgi:spiro-SPASM protein
LALERARDFPGVTKTVVLASDENFARLAGQVSGMGSAIAVEKRPSWDKRGLLEAIAVQQEGFDLAYFAWVDCPFLDPGLAGSIRERHLRYAAEYSYADGWPYGLAPELLAPGTAAVLSKILGDDGGQVGRDALFSVIQKDINAFDIETEISPVDLRCHRLNLCADSKRNLLLLRRFMDAAGSMNAGALPGADDVERVIADKPETLRTLPNFYPVQVYSGCPQKCTICPYPAAGDTGGQDFMEAAKFESLLDKIVCFSGDAVVDLSLWGELALHPQKMKLIEMVLSRPSLALVIETSGIGWKAEELEYSAAIAEKADGRKSPLPPLSWIVSLDTNDSGRYRELRGPGFAEAQDCAKKLLSLFPKDAYVQAVRTAGAEDDIERFYRSWKEAAPGGATNIIIQKYDDFCGVLPKKQASDLSPVTRQPCWHIMRDMPILIDGTVPLCKENIAALSASANDECGVMGNVFSDSLESIWENGQRFYAQHCEKKYEGLCVGCDEYYTYNF